MGMGPKGAQVQDTCPCDRRERRHMAGPYQETHIIQHRLSYKLVNLVKSYHLLTINF